jgi:DNA-binding LacI/PurR family transcriptional regulator
MTRRTGLVGVWMCLQYSRYRSQVLDRLRTVLGRTELALAVTDVDEEYHWNHSFDRALRVPVEGIIAFDASASIDAFARDYDRLAPATPFVSMGAYWSESKSYVGIDLKCGAEAAMDHLLATGRRRIAYMAPWNSDLVTTGPRYQAYKERMLGSGLSIRTISTPGVALSAVKESIEEALGAPDAPDAFLCMNDDLAMASSFALDRLGLKAGVDVALIGFDGIEETEDCPCPITTVRQPIEEMCALTFEFLRAQMEDPSAPLQQRILKPTLVIRSSTQG